MLLKLKNMQPFSEELWKQGKKVITRDGREVTQLVKFEGVYDDYILAGVVGNGIESWTIKGRESVMRESYLDLFHPEEKWTIDVPETFDKHPGYFIVYSKTRPPAGKYEIVKI